MTLAVHLSRPEGAPPEPARRHRFCASCTACRHVYELWGGQACRDPGHLTLQGSSVPPLTKPSAVLARSLARSHQAIAGPTPLRVDPAIHPATKRRTHKQTMTYAVNSCFDRGGRCSPIGVDEPLRRGIHLAQRVEQRHRIAALGGTTARRTELLEPVDRMHEVIEGIGRDLCHVSGQFVPPASKEPPADVCRSRPWSSEAQGQVVAAVADALAPDW